MCFDYNGNYIICNKTHLITYNERFVIIARSNSFSMNQGMIHQKHYNNTYMSI